MKRQLSCEKNSKRSKFNKLAVFIVALSCQLLVGHTNAQTGTWTAVANLAGGYNQGVCLLMPDGTVICHNATGGSYGTGWDKLTPDIHGSYANGTWSTIASMNNDRLFFGTQVFPNGDVYAAGGEYGPGGTHGEFYSPVTNTWTNATGVPNGWNIFDGNSEILYNGTVLQGVQEGSRWSYDNLIYTLGTNAFTAAPQSLYNHDEAEWVKLPDSTVLFVGINSTSSNRYEPKTNTWINDGTLPVNIWDGLSESGAGLMLPNGKAIFFGATQHNAIYTPSGNTNPGTWAAAADFPKIGGNYMGQSDAPAAMMVNGHILCAVAPIYTGNTQFPPPVYFVEYNYLTNTFTQVTNTIPVVGTDSLNNISSYQVQMLDLPDGTVLVSVSQDISSRQYYIYTPGSAAIPQGKPTINSIYQTTCGSYYIRGKLFNGISEGAAYGDDWQMSTNYPLVRLTSGTNVYYATTSNWNRIGALQTDSLEDTAQFVLPVALPAGTYSLVVVANGFASNPTVFTYAPLAVAAAVTANVSCHGGTNGDANATATGGKSPYTYKWANSSTTVSTSNPSGAVLTAGTYTVTVTDNIGCTATSTVTITQPNTLTIAISSHVNATCNTLGSATSSPALGGTSPYTYLWSPSGGTTLNATGLSAGTYTITATDNHGCTATASITIGTGSLIRDSVASITYPLCNGSDGSATIGYKGGTAPYTFTWSPNTNTTATATNLTAGTYTVTVNDKNNCPTVVSLTITQPTLLTVTTTVASNVNCNGGNNGSATANPGGGTIPYTYSWSGGGTNATKTALTAGTYTITLKDKNGCTATATAIITQPILLTVTATATANVNCSGGNNGSVSSTPAGGISPYTYAWSGGGTNATKTGLTAGTYTITVRDKNGCTATATASVTQPALLTVSATTTSQITCNGANNGVISATPSGGTAAYTYAWSGGGTNSTKSGLSNGTYTVTVTDAHGCTATTSTTVIQPATLIVAAHTTTNILCNGNATGVITSTVSGGTAPYTYLWTGGGTNATETGLSAGTYTITLTDAHGCTATSSTVVAQPPPLTITASTTANELCNGENIGRVSSVATGGTAPYTYAWSGGGTNSTKSALTAGTYTITVTDKSGCTATASTAVTQPNLLTATATIVSNVGCTAASGNLSATVSGGTTPYTYSWTGGSTQSTLTGLTVGTYTLGVRDANGCTATSSATITQAPVLSVAPSATNVLCNGGNSGSAAANASGGSTPYTYVWTGGNTNSTATGLSIGNYTVTVTDNSGCSATGSATITQPTQLLLSAGVTTNVFCNGGSNGVASSTPSGGTAPYTYLWTGGSTNSFASGLSAGTYTVTAHDNNGCSSTATATIAQPALLNASASITAKISCNGESNGTATASATGGTSPYTYAWSGGGSNAAKTGLSPGTYTITITDNNGCAGTASTTITQPSALLLVQGSNPTILGRCLGTAWVTVSGGTAGYIYDWSPGGATTDTINKLCVGSYCCKVTDKNGCIDSVCINVVTGIQALNNASSIQIYPDPTNGNFTISGVIRGQVIELYNYLGQLVSSVVADDATMQFNIADKANGVYLIRIENKDGSVVTQQKMIKTE